MPDGLASQAIARFEQARACARRSILVKNISYGESNPPIGLKSSAHFQMGLPLITVCRLTLACEYMTRRGSTILLPLRNTTLHVPRSLSWNLLKLDYAIAHTVDRGVVRGNHDHCAALGCCQYGINEQPSVVVVERDGGLVRY